MMSGAARRVFPAFAFALALFAGGLAAADVEILSPAAGTELSGVIEVTARVVPPRGLRAQRVVAQAETGEQVRLAPKFAGTYSGMLDTTRLPNGRQTLLAVMTIEGVDAWRYKPERTAWSSTIRNYMAEIEVIVRNPYQFYWGDLHAHTSYSDGCRVPKEAYEYARDTARLDFFAVTDHSQLLSADEYADVIAQAERFDQPGRFVALYGAEATGSTGHLCFYLSPVFRLPAGLDALYRMIGRMELLGHFNHPDTDSPADQGWEDDFQGFHHVPAADRSMALVEVRQPAEEAAYIAMLDAGWHVGAVGCQDQHDATWGTGGSSWTVVLARELTRAGIMEALWARRAYSAGDRNVQINFTVDGEDMGAQVVRRAGPVSCLVSVADPDTSDAVDRIDLFLDGAIVRTVRPGLTKYAWAASLDVPPGEHYCFVRVTQTGDRMSWSSPVWISAY